MRYAIIGAFLAISAAASTSFAAEKAKATHLNVKLSTKGNDIAFDQTAIQVPFGQNVQLTFTNEAAKGSEILHNVAILKPGTLDTVIKEIQAVNYDLEKIHGNKNILTMTKSLEPGSAQTLEFTPSEPGFYPYICVMPGHADMLGMKGVLNVKK